MIIETILLCCLGLGLLIGIAAIILLIAIAAGVNKK
jgi:hypothetical protein